VRSSLECQGSKSRISVDEAWGQSGDPEEEGRSSLEDVIRGLVKTHQTENT
jgi:hypothetical protein